MIKGTVTAKATPFAAAVKWAAGFLAAKPSIPIHGGLRLEADSGTLTVTAFSEYVSAVASLPYEGDGEGSVIVSGRLIKELAGTFPAKPVVISSATSDTVVIEVGRWRGTMPTMSDEDYPAVPPLPETIGLVDGDGFARAVAEVVAAVSKDDAQPPFLRSVLIEFGHGQACIVGTDRYRAALATATYGGADGHSVLVLGNQMEDVAAGFMGPDHIEIGLSETQVSMASPTRSVVLSTISMGSGQESYPAEMLRRFLAVDPPEKAVVRVPDLVVPLKRAALMREKEGPVAVRFSPEVATIVSRSGEMRRDGDEEVDIDYSGPETTLHFNPQYFADALSSAPGGEVTIAFDSTTHPNGNPKPVLLTVAGSPWRHVMQPIKAR